MFLTKLFLYSPFSFVVVFNCFREETLQTPWHFMRLEHMLTMQFLEVLVELQVWHLSPVVRALSDPLAGHAQNFRIQIKFLFGGCYVLCFLIFVKSATNRG